jgi:hypothetical protein
MVHLCKLAVGVRDVTHLAALQERRLAHPPLRHVTRNLPRRRDEIIARDSIYWLIGGFLRVRQRVVDTSGASPLRSRNSACCSAMVSQNACDFREKNTCLTSTRRVIERRVLRAAAHRDFNRYRNKSWSPL